MSRVELDCIPADRLAEVWPVLRPLFVEAYRRAPSDIDADGLMQRGLEGHVSFYAVMTPDDCLGAFCVGVIGDTVHVFALAGQRFHIWGAPVLAEFEVLARQHGMKRITFTGRDGWAKRLAPLGFCIVESKPDLRLEKMIDG